MPLQHNDPKPPGMLNGTDPHMEDLARAPQLGALAALYAVCEPAYRALRAAHPELRDHFEPPPGDDPLLTTAADALHIIADLRGQLRRYANQLGVRLLW